MAITLNKTCSNCSKMFYNAPSHTNTVTCSLACRNEYFSGTKGINYKHGGSLNNKLENNSYRAMKERCYNPKYRAYHRYGGRGITICERWLDKKTGFTNFLNDMGKKPTPKHSIDRIDNEGNYEPGNCKWSTQKEQVRNSSTCK